MTGSDLDAGWTGNVQNVAVVPNSTLTGCLTTCDANGSQPCDIAAPTGQGSINGTTFGPPLPVVLAGYPVCVVNRWNADPSGSVDPLTGDMALQVNLASQVYLTSASQVCPRCTSSQCDSGANQGGSCTVESTITVAGASGNNVYNLSSECPPTASQLVATLDLALPLTTGTAAKQGPTPCAAQAQDDNCPTPFCVIQQGQTNGTCSNNNGRLCLVDSDCIGGCKVGNCTGNACVSMGTDPVTGAAICIDAKGGLSQNCCDSSTTTACFPTANSRQLVRTGKPSPPSPAFPDKTYPKTGDGVLAAVLCIPASGNSGTDQLAGLPGPGALILPVATTWLRTLCLSAADCNDGNACTTDTCGGDGVCMHTLVVCGDNNACTTDSCDPSLGCQYAPVPNGTSCSDGNVCNGAETCRSGVCTPGTPLDCDDGNPCTNDSCNAQTGCIHLNNAASCEDGDACTAGDFCHNGGCEGGPRLNCDDGNPCTVDTCSSAAGCIHTPIVGCTASTTTTTVVAPGSTTSTTLPCPADGFEGLRCVLRIAADLPECSEDHLPAAVERRVTQASNLIDHGAVQRNPTKARKLVRKAAKALKKGASRAATAGMKGKLSIACGDAMTSILRDAEHRAEQLAATL